MFFCQRVEFGFRQDARLSQVTKWNAYPQIIKFPLRFPHLAFKFLLLLIKSRNIPLDQVPARSQSPGGIFSDLIDYWQSYLNRARIGNSTDIQGIGKGGKPAFFVDVRGRLSVIVFQRDFYCALTHGRHQPQIHATCRRQNQRQTNQSHAERPVKRVFHLQVLTNSTSISAACSEETSLRRRAMFGQQSCNSLRRG